MVSVKAAVRRLFRRICTERNFFLPYELLLILPGFRLAPHIWSGRAARIFFAAYRAVQVIQYALWADRCYLALTDPSVDSSTALHTCNTFAALTMMLFRLLAIVLYTASMEQMHGYLLRQRGPTPPATGSYRKIIHIALAFQSIGVFDRLVYCLSRTYRDELYPMPSNAVEAGWVAVWLVHVFSFDFANRWAAAYNVSLTGMNSIMLGLSDELAEIAQEYQLLLVVHPRADFWAQLERNVARTVRRHEEFLHQLDQLKPFLRTTFLLMFYSAALFLALGTFMISTSGLTTYNLFLSGWLVAVLMECYWCCQLVDSLNETNAEIGAVLYGLEWPTELRYSPPDASRYRQARSALLIMMSKTQKSFGITCGGMFEMSREAFASLVKLTYTMLMFLRDSGNFSD